MIKKIIILFFLILCMVPEIYAQRKGSVNTGGLISFRSFSGSDSSTSSLDIEWLVGYYLNRKTAFEFEPIINIDFLKDNTSVTSIILAGMAYRLFDVVPDNYERRRKLGRDLGTTPGVFATAKGGLWVNGFSQKYSDKPTTYTGPALALGIGTYSGLSKTAMMRIMAQFIYLLPNGSYYTEPRTVIQIGVGFSVFIVL